MSFKNVSRLGTGIKKQTNSTRVTRRLATMIYMLDMVKIIFRSYDYINFCVGSESLKNSKNGFIGNLRFKLNQII